MRGDGGLARNGRRWLVGVRDKLSRHDGLQLVKILYYRDPGISGRDLDGADSVFHIYSLSKDSLGGDGEAAVALLYYRLSLLVLQRSVEGANGLDTGLDPGKLLRAKDLGGQDCLKYYAECGLITPPEPSVQPEARLLECFVTAYVNLSPRKRKQLREILADTVGVYRVKQLDLFNLFCRFLHQSDEESTADKFIITLNNAEVPQQVFDQLQTQLANHNISYHPIAREELKTQAETEEDCLSETEFLPPDIKEKPGVCKRICTIPRVACAFVFIVPLVLFAVAVSVSTSTIKSQAQSQSAVRHYDTSGILFESSLCNTRDRDTPPLIYIGTISNQWTSGFRLTQDVPNKEKYAYKNLNVYTVPSNKVIKYKKLFNCSTANYHSPVELELQGVYFLRGTNMTFKVCILSKQDEDGWVGLAFI